MAAQAADRIQYRLSQVARPFYGEGGSHVPQIVPPYPSSQYPAAQATRLFAQADCPVEHSGHRGPDHLPYCLYRREINQSKETGGFEPPVSFDSTTHPLLQTAAQAV